MAHAPAFRSALSSPQAHSRLSACLHPTAAVGGHVLAHASTVRLSVRKGKAEQRLMKVVQAPSLQEAEASYAIGGDGINDYKD